MKSLSFAPVALLGFAARQAAAHYTFPYFVDAGSESSAWQYIRQTENFNSQAPVTDVTSPLFKCYETSTAAQTSVITLQAGGTYTFRADGPIYHPGYLDVMMSAVSDPTSESAASGATWFKIFEDPPVYDPSGSNFYTFPSQTSSDVTFTIPAATPSGSYLIRVEQIALHVASTFGGAQFYLGCAEVKVTGGGSGTPGPLVSIPGVYTGNEPGILINIYEANPNGAYISPGPAVWTGGSSGTGGGGNPPHTTSKATAPTSSTSSPPSKTTTTSGGSTTGIAQYGQCGGQSYTGSTTCASPYKCVVENPYYSQCQ